MFFLKVVGLLGLNVDDADDAIFNDERDGEFGVDLGIGVDVVFELADLGDEHGLTAEGDLAGDSLSEVDAQAFDFRAMADLEAHAEVVHAGIDEEDGEDAIVDDGANEGGGALQEGLEIEGGIEGVGESQEEFSLARLDADGGRGGRRSRASGAVIALKRLGVILRGGLGASFGHDSPVDLT